MKYLKTIMIATALSASVITPAMADVGVSVTVGQPGFYGRIDIGGYPQPRVIYTQPRVIYREAIRREPIYLRVPPGHAKNWRKHCQQYNACQERVYFVQDSWYQQEYAPRYQEQHRTEYHDDHYRDERHDDDRYDHDRGNGHGRDNHQNRGHGRDDHNH